MTHSLAVRQHDADAEAPATTNNPQIDWRKAVLWRAVQLLAIAVRQGRATAEFEVINGGLRTPMLASILATTGTPHFSISVHERSTGQLVCESVSVWIGDVNEALFYDDGFDSMLDDQYPD